MTREELTNVFKYIVKKCDMLINNGDYKADAYTQDTVEDIAELCNHILDGDYEADAHTQENSEDIAELRNLDGDYWELVEANREMYDIFLSRNNQRKSGHHTEGGHPL